VVLAADGERALNYLRSGPRSDLILLDMLLPRMDGWHLLDALRAWSRPLRVPIIVVTGTCLSREWAEAHGCAGFLAKPVEPDELLAEIARCLGT
jgi:CheY-like chemotaxis protein